MNLAVCPLGLHGVRHALFIFCVLMASKCEFSSPALCWTSSQAKSNENVFLSLVHAFSVRPFAPVNISRTFFRNVDMAGTWPIFGTGSTNMMNVQQAAVFVAAGLKILKL